jgi:hypothetical protein
MHQYAVKWKRGLYYLGFNVFNVLRLCFCINASELAEDGRGWGRICFVCATTEYTLHDIQL